jgi:hypothetical protein
MACGDDDRSVDLGGVGVDFGADDASVGPDLGDRDGGADPLDGGDEGEDAGSPPDDGGTDLGTDGGTDRDGGTDLGTDGGLELDGGVDLGADGGPPDMGPACEVGGPCTSLSGCAAAGAECVEDSLFGSLELGGTGDPIADYPPGESTPIPYTLFEGGLCTTSYPSLTTDVCNPDEGTGCPACATCADVFGVGDRGVCLESCTPSYVDNDICRDGYTCSYSLGACFGGCSSDEECRVARAESNGVPGIQTPSQCSDEPLRCRPADCDTSCPASAAACSSPETNFDGLVYDLTSTASCDPDTFRCVDVPANPSAAGGDPCESDAQCEANGFCIEETRLDRDDPAEGTTWLGGYCSKSACDRAGNGCANGAKCQSAGVGTPICVEACTVGGVSPSSDPATWAAVGAARTTCREGYGCYWDGVGGAGTADNGACLPVEYEPAVAAPNTGAACLVDSDCFSPFGAGLCIRGGLFEPGYCSQRGCAAPWFDGAGDICGANAECVGFDPADPTDSLCLQQCTSAADCTDGYGCVAVTGTAQRHCWPTCSSDADCGDGRCTGAGTSSATCVRCDGNADCGGGDAICRVPGSSYSSCFTPECDSLLGPDCPSSEVCSAIEGGLCVACEDDADCPGSDVCVDGGLARARCVTPACSSDADCPDHCANPGTVDAVCTACRTDADCAGGEACLLANTAFAECVSC